MDLKIREPNSDTRGLADQAYAASPADAARCLQSWLSMGVTFCNWGPSGVSGNNGPESEASPYRVVYVKSRFAFTTELDTSHARLSLRYVVRWPAQPAAVADAEDKLITI